MPKRKYNSEKIMEPTEERGPYGDLKSRAFKAEIARMTGIKREVINEVFTALQDLTAEELYWYGRVTIPDLVTFVRTENDLKVSIPSDYENEDGTYRVQKIYAIPDKKMKFLVKADTIFKEKLPEPTRNNWRDIVSAVRVVVYGKVNAKYIGFKENTSDSRFSIILDSLKRVSNNRLLSKKDRDKIIEDSSFFIDNQKIEERSSKDDLDDFLDEYL